MSRTSDTVCAVMVTYGDRAAMALELADLARSRGVSEVILVDNGSKPAASSLSVPTWVHVVRLDRNTGSANGFRAGLEKALSGDASHVLLLDDDNELAAGALDVLLLASRIGGTRTAMALAYRPILEEQVRAIETPSSFALPPVGAFMLFDFYHRVRRRLTSTPASPLAGAGEYVPMPYAPYGGLLIPMAVLRDIDLPDPNLVLYEDDSVFTAAAVRKGYEIWLCPSALVHDRVGKWLDVGVKQIGPVQLLRTRSRSQLFYGVRNRIYFETHVLKADKLRYLSNFVLYLAVTIVSVRRRADLTNLRIILRACLRGFTGQLGFETEFPLGDEAMDSRQVKVGGECI